MANGDMCEANQTSQVQNVCSYPFVVPAIQPASTWTNRHIKAANNNRGWCCHLRLIILSHTISRAQAAQWLRQCKLWHKSVSELSASFAAHRCGALCFSTCISAPRHRAHWFPMTSYVHMSIPAHNAAIAFLFLFVYTQSQRFQKNHTPTLTPLPRGHPATSHQPSRESQPQWGFAATQNTILYPSVWVG